MLLKIESCYLGFDPVIKKITHSKILQEHKIFEFDFMHIGS